MVSYLGLSVAITANRAQFDLTVLGKGARPEQVGTSLLVPLSPTTVDGSMAPTSVALILYAETPGAFVDLAADLSWITGRPLADFRIDEHRSLPANYTDPAPLAAMSDINQALGVLIGRGLTPEQAERDLHGRAVAAGVDLVGAATLILAGIPPPVPGPDHL